MSSRARFSIERLDGDGPDAALALAYRQHWHGLCRYVRTAFGAGPPEPEDVAQAAFEKFAGVDAAQVANPEAFLRRTARNIAIDAHRRNGRTMLVERSLEIFEAGTRDPGPESVLESRDELKRLDTVIATLKPKQRIALLLHRIDGLSFVEIAREMGVSPSGARLLVDTALAICTAAMKGRTQ